MSNAAVVLAKRYAGAGGPGPIWVYESEPCPCCDAGRLDGEPCGVCRGTGVLFEDGYRNELQVRALLLHSAGRTEELLDLAEQATTAYMDELQRGEVE